MTIEEKAKAYDEVVGRIEAYHNIVVNKQVKSELEKILPKLAESKDERIRKALIHLVNSNKELSFGIDNYDGIKWSDILAWLEKQGEQKAVDIQPIFEVGDVMRTKEEAEKGWKNGMPVVVSIDNEYYHCHNELIAIGDQYDYEYPPMNRSIVNASPSKEYILNVWELGDYWREMTKGMINTEYGSQVEYIQKHWEEGAYYDQIH